MNENKMLSAVLKILLCAGLLLPGGLQIGKQPAVAGQAGEIGAETAEFNAPDPAPAPEKLRRFADEAIRKLSLTSGFASWSGASADIEPFGPGTHSWLVTVRTGGMATGNETPPDGYLIISAAAGGEYKLVEYGTGPGSPYAKPTLQFGLGGLGVTMTDGMTILPVYAGPALAAWKIVRQTGAPSVQFLDASSGELLPESTESWDRQAMNYNPPKTAAGGGQPGLSPGRVLSLSAGFDPYDNLLWMTDKALTVTPDNFISLLEASKRLVLVASGPERTYSLPLPVYGYQRWTDGELLADGGSGSAIYVLTGSDSSTRLIALDSLLNSGSFVKYCD